MGKTELDVFLSSDQREFGDLRTQISTEICSIPFLTCTPLEKRGAESTNAREASLEAVRESDIYVGLFGEQYSETTIMEYNEAFNAKKPCLAYVKDFQTRDKRLAEFLTEVLKRDLKYYPFSDGKELLAQLKIDLRRFILKILTIGLEEWPKRQKETIAKISKEEKTEEKAAANNREPQGTLTNAKDSIKQGNYLESLIISSAIIETTLKKVLEIKGISGYSTSSLSDIIKVAEKMKLFNTNDIQLLRRISINRNEAIHLGITPDQENSKDLIRITQHLLNVAVTQKTGVDGHKKIPGVKKPWKHLPVVRFKVAQSLTDTFRFPQVGWEVYNDSLYQLKMRFEIHPILGKRDFHPLSDNDINGTNEYEVEPKSYVFANGCFTLPAEVALSNEELILEIRATVEDINDLKKKEHKLVPKRWKYVRETNSWSYFPQRPRSP